ncbi:GIY-YIG nuclease family protein [Marinicella gelatinilytica]|uniref:GIY-YIG nuclease family protein n=1 Tax=Marinicella gelatinilytica TaxID=2996017 RepID=UPI00142B3BB2|nr:GIY-YIG nuclease family protein [Marinicella gelatinilytica]KAA3645722.1 MAG: GIY-YIG nuclease family protein [Pseudomonadota bacterium]MCX7543848.1 GIY-YIG nuclease family protein [Marinicella gelatinilytica]
MKHPAVYILTNKRNGTLYIGATDDLIRRIYEHKNELVDGFTKKYHLHKLVYYELHESKDSALLRESQMKEWKRAWKINLIEKNNPYWNDLYLDFI